MGIKPGSSALFATKPSIQYPQFSFLLRQGPGTQYVDICCAGYLSASVFSNLRLQACASTIFITFFPLSLCFFFCTFLCLYTCPHNTHTYRRIYTHSFMHIHNCRHIHIYLYTHINTITYAHIIYISIYVHTYKNIYIHM